MRVLRSNSAVLFPAPLLVTALLLAAPVGAPAREPDAPAPDTLPELTARICGLVEPLSRLAGAVDPGSRAAAPAAAVEAKLAHRLAALAAEVDRVCLLYQAEGERLFLGQEVSAVYRRRRAVERALSRAALPPGLEASWQDLQAALVRLHEAVDWRAFNAWYLEKDGDSD